jgi:protein-S-isoprenylcysteine O-methyltransferase Ste14
MDTIETIAGKLPSAVAPSPPPPAGLRGIWELVVRFGGGAWFLLLAFVYARMSAEAVIQLQAGGAHALQWPEMLSRACVFVFCLTLSWLMFVRPPARARAAGLLPGVIAFVATYSPWVLAFLPRGQLSPTVAVVSATLSLAGSVLLVYSVLFLGRSFSIVPQARGLVTGGPYAIVRHPLYLAEEIAIAGLFLQFASVAVLPLFVIHVGLQVWRTYYEEAVLRGFFPEYAGYARRTFRLIPGLW